MSMLSKFVMISERDAMEYMAADCTIASTTLPKSFSLVDGGVYWSALRNTRQMMRTDEKSTLNDGRWRAPRASEWKRPNNVPEQSTLEVNEREKNASKVNTLAVRSPFGVRTNSNLSKSPSVA